MSESIPLPELVFACAVLRRSVERNTEVLIVRPHGQGERAKWAFPAGPVEAGESPEAACRRACRDRLGLEVTIELGQPPLQERVGEQTVTYRYFFCQIVGGHVRNLGFAEIRWVLVGQLPDYEFDPVSQTVAEWLRSNL